MTVKSLRLALVPRNVTVIVTLVVVAIVLHLPLIDHVQLIEEETIVRDIVLVATNSSQHKIRPQNIGRIPRGNVPILVAE